jgi:exodeoxyribonuclease-3
MLRVVSANLNGIRSANVKGFLNWLNKQDADVVCVQELKAQIDDLSPEMRKPGVYTGYFHCAVKKGYSGVGIYCRRPPDRVIEGLGNEEFDVEGRYLQLDFGSLSVVSLYLPFRFQLGRAPGCKVSLHGSLSAAHGRATRERP